MTGAAAAPAAHASHILRKGKIAYVQRQDGSG